MTFKEIMITSLGVQGIRIDEKTLSHILSTHDLVLDKGVEVSLKEINESFNEVEKKYKPEETVDK